MIVVGSTNSNSSSAFIAVLLITLFCRARPSCKTLQDWPVYVLPLEGQLRIKHDIIRYLIKRVPAHCRVGLLGHFKLSILLSAWWIDTVFRLSMTERRLWKADRSRKDCGLDTAYSPSVSTVFVPALLLPPERELSSLVYCCQT
jgi:nitroreductase